MSDGVTECPSWSGQELGTDGLLELLRKFGNMPSSTLLEALIWDLAKFAGSDDFPDDVSGLMFDYIGGA
jgi:sigma-B regulation protein RsbU (phosphoserine phosphatase)